MSEDSRFPYMPFGDDAWLQLGEERIPIDGIFNIGRSSKCRHVIANTKVSREHAILQRDDINSCWMVIDLGSTNGTYVNGTRINKPTVLQNQDAISIGGTEFTFFADFVDDDSQADTVAADQTVVSMESNHCWLVLADVKQSTQWVQQFPPDEVSAKFRLWGKDCEQIILQSGGVVNEYLGDGILSFWRDTPNARQQVLDAMQRFRAMKSRSGLEYRIVIHFGEVGFGGGMSSGVEKLFGRELNFVFKIEKSAGLIDRPLTLTQAASDQLKDLIKITDLGGFFVNGFTGDHHLYEPHL